MRVDVSIQLLHLLLLRIHRALCFLTERSAWLLLATPESLQQPDGALSAEAIDAEELIAWQHPKHDELPLLGADASITLIRKTHNYSMLLLVLPESVEALRFLPLQIAELRLDFQVLIALLSTANSTLHRCGIKYQTPLVTTHKSINQEVK